MKLAAKAPVSEFWRQRIAAHVEATLAQIGQAPPRKARNTLQQACPFRHGSPLGCAWWSEVAQRRAQSEKDRRGKEEDPLPMSKRKA